MENQEFKFKGAVLNGFLMLFVNIAVLVVSIYMIVDSIIVVSGGAPAAGNDPLSPPDVVY